MTPKKRGRPFTIPDDPDDPRPNKKDDTAAYQRWLRRHTKKAQAPTPTLAGSRAGLTLPANCIGRIAYEREDHNFVIRLNDEGKRRLYAGEMVVGAPVILAEVPA